MKYLLAICTHTAPPVPLAFVVPDSSDVPAPAPIPCWLDPLAQHELREVGPDDVADALVATFGADPDVSRPERPLTVVRDVPGPVTPGGPVPVSRRDVAAPDGSPEAGPRPPSHAPLRATGGAR